MPASPFTRYLVGWMFVLCGVLLALGLLLRIGVSIYLWRRAGGTTDLSSLALLAINLLAVAAAGLLGYYGWRVLRGAHIRGGSSGKPIL